MIEIKKGLNAPALPDLSREDLIRLNYMVSVHQSKPISVVELNDKLTKLKYTCHASIQKLMKAGLVQEAGLEIVDDEELTSLYIRRPLSEARYNNAHPIYIPTSSGIKLINENF